MFEQHIRIKSDSPSGCTNCRTLTLQTGVCILAPRAVRSVWETMDLKSCECLNINVKKNVKLAFVTMVRVDVIARVDIVRKTINILSKKKTRHVIVRALVSDTTLQCANTGSLTPATLCV